VLGGNANAGLGGDGVSLVSGHLGRWISVQVRRARSRWLVSFKDVFVTRKCGMLEAECWRPNAGSRRIAKNSEELKV
jgi:hypothetical protein